MRFVPSAGVLALFAGLFLILPTAAVGQQFNGYWQSASTTAQSITGDITLSSGKITLAFHSFPLAEIRALQASEVSAVFDAAAPTARGELYRLDVPATLRLQHKNTLCGTDATAWLVAVGDGNRLSLAFFSGSKPPELTAAEVSNSTSLCGTFSYTR